MIIEKKFIQYKQEINTIKDRIDNLSPVGCLDIFFQYINSVDEAVGFEKEYIRKLLENRIKLVKTIISQHYNSFSKDEIITVLTDIKIESEYCYYSAEENGEEADFLTSYCTEESACNSIKAFMINELDYLIAEKHTTKEKEERERDLKELESCKKKIAYYTRLINDLTSKIGQ